VEGGSRRVHQHRPIAFVGDAALSPDHRFFADRNIGVDYTVWSPDNRFILFDRNNPQGGDIYKLNHPE
jgi:hypothetical protein